MGRRVLWSSSDSEPLEEELQEEQRQGLEKELQGEEPREEQHEGVGAELEEDEGNQLRYTHPQESDEEELDSGLGKKPPRKGCAGTLRRWSRGRPDLLGLGTRTDIQVYSPSV